MKLLLSCAVLVALVSWPTLYAQAAKLSDQDFRRLAASHANAEEHQKLSGHYLAHATEHEADAKLHEEFAAQYGKTEPSLAGEARHYAAHSREAAEALRELAKIHQTLAKEHVAKK
jgi:biopolymer transport protein ExbB/TolQ